MPAPRIGELLIAEGLLTPAAVNRALGFQKSTAPRVKLGSILLTWDLIDEGNLLKALAALHRCEAVTGEMLTRAPAEVVRLLPSAHAIRLNAVPYALRRSRIYVAFVNPSDIGAIDEVSAVTGHACVPGVVTELRLLQAHRRFYGRSFPLELRPVVPRTEPRHSSLRESQASAPPAARTIPVSGKPTARAPGEDAVAVRIPDPPAPSVPQASPVPAAASEPDAAAMWIPALPEQPQSEAVLGMWSPAPRVAVAPPPAQDLGDLALSAVPAEFPRAILLAEREGALVGWRARGIDGRNPGAIRLPLAEPSVFSSVVRTGTHHFGRVETERWPASLARLFDGPPPCAIFPVQSGHGLAAVLYADRRGAPMKFEDTAALARAAAEIASLLARVSSRRTH